MSAQNAEQIKLAQQYMMNGEYDKARDIYEEMYKTNPTSQTIYRNYYNCLLMILDYKEIEKIISKQIKKNSENLTYYVDLGNAYKKQGEIEKKEAVFQEAINKISDSRMQVTQLANAFMGIDELQNAITVYEKGQSKVKEYSFNYELANLYYRAGDNRKSIETYLNYMREPESNFNNVCNALLRMLQDEKDHELLQELIYERIGKNDDPLYAELLIWDFIQLKDFDGAFIQAKALDKRYKENGERIYELGEIAKNEKNYQAAIACFEYVAKKGEESTFYYAAKSAILNCLRLKIADTNNYTQTDIDALEKMYLDFLNEYKRADNRAASITTDLAKLEAFYNHKPDSAIALLEKSVTWPAISAAQRSEMKLALGDFYLFTGNVWDATLIYSQVDKAMKDDPLGEEARFKNAKLAYYRGDFTFSQAQLDILKAATSELVANDAMKLSIFITSNLGLDTVPYPMMLYAQADLYFFQNKISESEETLNLILNKYPAHGLTDDIYFFKYKIFSKQNNIDSAIVYLEKIRQNYSYDLLADDAIFALAELYQYSKKDFQKAQACYEEIILNYKDSLYVNEARKRFRTLRGDNIN